MSINLKHFSVSDLDDQIQKLTIAIGPVIIRSQKGKSEILLVKHDDPFWKFPGGSLNDGDIFKQNAIREAKEELNIIVELDDHEPFILTFVKNHEVFILVHYLARIVEGEPIPCDDVTEFAWFEIENLPDDCAPNVKPVLEFFKN